METVPIPLQAALKAHGVKFLHSVLLEDKVADVRGMTLWSEEDTELGGIP